MKAALILLAVFLLTACGSSRREPTPTPTKTHSARAVVAEDLATATPTPQPLIVATQPPATVALLPTPTEAVQVVPIAASVDLVAAERLLRVYTFHGGIEVGLADAAAQVASGAADGLEGFGMLLALSAFVAAADEGLNYDFGSALASSVDVARQQQTVLQDIVQRWVDKQITSADVPGLLEQIDAEAAVLAYVDELGRLGVTPDELGQMVQNIDEDIQQASAAMEEIPSQPSVTDEPPQSSAHATAIDVANLRGGPGTDFPIVGSVAAGQVLNIVGRNAAGDWYQLGDGNWIAAFLVSGAPGDVAVVDVPMNQPVEAAPNAPVVEQPTVAPVLPTAAPFTCAGGCATPPDVSCAIKGNVNSSGDRIYHTTDSRSYANTNVRPEEGDRWFCTSEEAQAAGFRAPQN